MDCIRRDPAFPGYVMGFKLVELCVCMWGDGGGMAGGVKWR